MSSMLAPTTQPAVDAMKILTDVNSLYTSGLTWLIAVLGVGVVFVGVVMPLVLHWRQDQSFKGAEERLKNEIASEVSRLERIVEERTNATQGQVFDVMAESMIERGDDRADIINMLLMAALCSLRGGNHTLAVTKVKQAATVAEEDPSDARGGAKTLQEIVQLEAVLEKRGQLENCREAIDKLKEINAPSSSSSSCGRAEA